MDNKRFPNPNERLAIHMICKNSVQHCGEPKNGCIFTGTRVIQKSPLGLDCIFNEIALKNNDDEIKIPTCSDWSNYIPIDLKIPKEVLVAASRVIDERDRLETLARIWCNKHFAGKDSTPNYDMTSAHKTLTELSTWYYLHSSHRIGKALTELAEIGLNEDYSYQCDICGLHYKDPDETFIIVPRGHNGNYHPICYNCIKEQGECTGEDGFPKGFPLGIAKLLTDNGYTYEKFLTVKSVEEVCDCYHATGIPFGLIDQLNPNSERNHE
jgi:hypothetical protein